MKRRPVCILLATLLTVSCPVRAARPLTIAEARRLVIVALETHTVGLKRLPGFEIDVSSDSAFPGFMTFDAIWQGVPEGGSSIDHIDVNMRTADVMDAIICETFNSKRVKRLQRQLRQKMGLTATDYRKFKLLGPYC